MYCEVNHGCVFKVNSSVGGKIVTAEIDRFETTDLVGSQLCV